MNPDRKVIRFHSSEIPKELNSIEENIIYAVERYENFKGNILVIKYECCYCEISNPDLKYIDVVYYKK